MLSTLRLSEEEQQSLGRDLVRLIEMDVRDRRPIARKIEIIRNIYHNNVERTLRYPGQSDIHLPVVTEKIEGTIPKIENAFWNADPIVHVEPIAEERASERTRANEIFLDWAVQVDIPDFHSSFETWCRNTLIDGVGYVMPYYCFKQRNSVVVETVKVEWRAGETDFVGNVIQAARIKLPLEILTEVFGLGGVSKSLVNFERTTDDPLSQIPDDSGEESGPAAEAIEAPQEEYDGMLFEVDFIDDRILYEGCRVEFRASRRVDEIDVVVYRPIVVRDGVNVEVIEWEDLIVPYRTKSLQDSERVTRQYWLTIDDVQCKQRDGEWDISEDDLIALRAVARGERQEEIEENAQIKDQKDSVIGETDSQSGGGFPELPAYMDNKILVFEVYCRYDVDGDGEAEEIILHIPYALRRVVRADYLDVVFPHGRRPFPDWHYLRIGGRWYSKSMGELLAPINVEVDAIINLVNDAQEVINNPWFFYQPAALGIDPGSLSKGLLPGQGVPVADPKGVVFPTFPQQPLANLSAMESMLMFADRLTLSPQSVGSSQVRNAPRTARGTLALLSESGVKNDMIISQAQHGGWRELIYQIHALYETFGPEERWIKVTKQDRRVKIARSDLRGRFEYSFSGNTVNTNREVSRSIAQVRYNTLVANPLYAMDLNAMLELTKDFLRAFNEGADISKMIPRLPSQGGSHAPLDQKDENEMMAAGMPVEVLATDDHAAHLAEMARFEATPRFGLLEQWKVSLHAVHKRQHLALMAAQQAAGAVAPGGTVGNNEPGAVGLNALEGGVQ